MTPPRSDGARFDAGASGAAACTASGVLLGPFEATPGAGVRVRDPGWAPITPQAATDALMRPGMRPAALGDRPPSLVDPLLEPDPVVASMPAPTISFDGMDQLTVSSLPFFPAFRRPDVTGDVSATYYLQAVNNSFAVFDKAGTLVGGPTPMLQLWDGFPGTCATAIADVVTLYDHLADRWLLTHMTGTPGVRSECIAISDGPDPRGSWWLYEVPIAADHDYPKWGVSTDSYWMSSNFGPSYIMAIERDKLIRRLPGDPPRYAIHVQPVVGPSFFVMPADLDGPPSPRGTPEVFLEPLWTGMLRIHEATVDWASPTPTVSIATTAILPISTHDAAPPHPQPDGASPIMLGTGTVAMFRLQLRDFGTHRVLAINQTVDAGGLAAVRWYQLEDDGGGWSLRHEGTFAPDGEHRFLGSAATDWGGNFAVGYNVSSASTYPGIRYAGRLAADPANTLAAGEGTLKDGEASDISGIDWGDYSMLAVDPADECTFWYTAEYMKAGRACDANGYCDWTTRVGAFRFSTADCSVVDRDADTVPDTTDNCLYVANADQADTDANGDGDACDECYLPAPGEVPEADSGSALAARFLKTGTATADITATWSPAIGAEAYNMWRGSIVSLHVGAYDHDDYGCHIPGLLHTMASEAIAQSNEIVDGYYYLLTGEASCPATLIDGPWGWADRNGDGRGETAIPAGLSRCP